MADTIKYNPQYDSTKGLKGLVYVEPDPSFSTQVTPSKLVGKNLTAYRKGLLEQRNAEISAMPEQQFIGDKFPEFGKSKYDYEVKNVSDLQDLNTFRAEQQSGFLKFTNAVIGGVVGAIGTAASDLSYMADYENYVALFNDVDVIEDNWLAKVGKDFRNSIYSTFPIYEKEGTSVGDKFFKFSTLRGILDSAIGFSVPGGVVARGVSKGLNLALDARRAIKGAEIANEALNAEKKGAYISSLMNEAENLIKAKGYSKATASLLAGAITNQAEGVMMATEEYENIKNRYIEDRAAKYIQDKYLGKQLAMQLSSDGTPVGLPENVMQEAKAFAERDFNNNKDLQLEIAKRQGDFVMQNRLFMLTDALGLHGLLKISDKATRAAKKPVRGALQSLGSFSTDNLLIQGAIEGFEEIGQNAFQLELGYQAGKKGDFLTEDQALENNKQFFSRLKDFALKDDSIVQGLMGLISGGAQRAFTDFAINTFNGDPLNKKAKQQYEEEYNKQQTLKNSYTVSKFQKMAELADIKGTNNEDTYAGKVRADLARTSGFYDILTEAFTNGTTGELETLLNSIAEMTDEEAANSHLTTEAEEAEAKAKGETLVKSHKTIAKEWLDTLRKEETVYNTLLDFHDAKKLMQLHLMINNHRDSKDNIDTKISSIKNSSDFMSMVRTPEEQVKVIEDKQKELEVEKKAILADAKESNKDYIENLFKQRAERINKYSGNKYYDTALGKELIELEETSNAIDNNIKIYTDEYLKISSPKYQRDFNKRQKEILAERIKFEADLKQKEETDIAQKADYIESVLKDIPEEEKSNILVTEKQKAEDNEDQATKKAIDEVQKREKVKQAKTSELDKLTDTLTDIRIGYNFGNYTKEGDAANNAKQKEVIDYLDFVQTKFTKDKDSFTSLADVKNDFIQKFAPDYSETTKDNYKDTVIGDIINSLDEFTEEAKPVIAQVLTGVEEEINSVQKTKEIINKEVEDFNIETSKIYAGSIANKISYKDRVYTRRDGRIINVGNSFESLHNTIIDPIIVHQGTELHFAIADGSQIVQDGFVDGKPNIITWENKLKRLLSSINILSTESMNAFFEKAFNDSDSLTVEEKIVFSKIISSTPIIIYTKYNNKPIQVGYMGEHYITKDADKQAELTKLFYDRKTILEAAFNQTLDNISSTISTVSNGWLSVNSSEEGDPVYTPVSAFKNSDVNVVVKRNTPSGTALYGSNRKTTIDNLDKADVGHPHIEVPIGENVSRLVSVLRDELKDLPIYKSSVINAINIFIKSQLKQVLSSEESDFLSKVKALEKTLKTRDKSFSFDLSTPQGLRNYVSLFINVTETTDSNLHQTIASKNIKDLSYRALAIEHIPSANNTMKILLSNGKDIDFKFTLSTGKDGRMYVTKDSISSTELNQALVDNLDSFQFNVDKNYLTASLENPKRGLNIPTFHNNNVIENSYSNYQDFIKHHLTTNILEQSFTNAEGKHSYNYTEQKQILFTNLVVKEAAMPIISSNTPVETVVPIVDDSIKESEVSTKEEQVNISEADIARKAMLKAKYGRMLEGVSQQSKKDENKLPSVALLESPVQTIINNIVSKTLSDIEGLSLITSNVNTVSIDHQQQLIQYLVNTLATNIINKLNGDIDNVTITSDMLNEMLEEQRDLFQLIKDEYVEEGSLIANHITEYLSKWDNVKSIVYSELKNIAGISSKTNKDLVEDNDDEDGSLNLEESTLDRNTFSDNFHLTLNPNNISSTRMRLSLYGLIGVGNKFYLDGMTEMPVNVSEVLGVLNGLLADMPANYQLMKEALLLKADTYTWIDSLISKLDNDEVLRNEFVKNMHKYTVNMTKVIIKEDGKISVIDSNANSVYINTLLDWNNRVLTSPLVVLNTELGKYVIDDSTRTLLFNLVGDYNVPNTLKGLLNKIKNKSDLTTDAEIIEDVQKIKQLFKNFLSFFNIELNDQLVDDIINGKYKLYNTDATTVSMFSLFDGNNSLFGQLLSKINNSNNIPTIFQGRLFKELIQRNAEKSAVVGVSSFWSGTKTITGFSFPKFITERTQEIMNMKNGKSELVDRLLELPFQSTSRILNGLKQQSPAYLESLKYGHLDLSPYSAPNSNTTGREYLDLTKEQQLAIRLAEYINNGRVIDGIRIGNIFYPTMSDKKTLMTLTMPLLDLNLTDSNALVDVVFDNLIQPEINRMQAWSEAVTKGKLPDIKYFNEGANMFYRVVGLNELSVKYNGSDIPVLVDIPLKLKDQLNTIQPGLGDSIKKVANPLLWADDANPKKKVLIDTIRGKLNSTVRALVAEQLSQWTKYNIKYNSSNNTFTNVPQEAIDYIKRKYPNVENSQVLAYLATDYTINNWVLNGEIEQVYTGDPALTMTKKALKATSYDNMLFEATVNKSKRLAADNANKYMGDVTNTPDLNIIVVNDIHKSSSTIEYYEKIGMDADTIANLKDADATDGAAFASLNEYLRLMVMNGKISTKDSERILDDYNNDRPLTEDSLNLILNPLKPVYSGNRIVDGWVDSRVFIKFAVVPLLKEFTTGTELDKLRKILDDSNNQKDRSSQIDMIVFDSAMKQGLPVNPITIGSKESKEFKNLDKLNRDSILSLPRKDYGIQLDKPFHSGDHEISVGTQALSSLFSSIRNIKGPVFNYQGNKKTVEELETIYNKLYEERFKRGLASLKKELLDEEGKIDIQKLKSIIYKEGVARGYSLNTLLGLQLSEDGKNFEFPLWSMGESEKIEALLMSIVTNRIIKLKHNGLGGILGSSVGVWEEAISETPEVVKTSIITSSNWDATKGLQGRRIDNKGNVLPAQIMLSSIFTDSFGTPIDVKTLVSKISQTTEDGKTIVDLEQLEQILPKELLEGFTFRIPTQGYSSMSMVEIVGFLPVNYGYTMLAPVDFIQQMGLDFDIDTNYTYFYKTTVIYDPKLGLNRLVKTDSLTDDQVYNIAINKIRQRLTSEKNNIINSSRQDLISYIETFRKDELNTIIDKLMEDVFEARVQNDILDVYLSVSKCTADNFKIQKLFSTLLNYGGMADNESQKYASKIDGFRKNKIQSTTPFTPLTAQFQFDAYNRANSSKNGIGSFATIGGLLNDITDKFTTPLQFVYKSKSGTNLFGITIDGFTTKGEIGKSKFSNGERPLLNMSSFLSVMVDEEKLRAAARLNINNTTIPAILGMTALGFSIEQILYLINQDIIHDYIEFKETDSDEVKAQTPSLMAINSILGRKFNLNIQSAAELFKFNEITTNDLLDGLSSNIKSDDSDHALNVLSIFTQASKVGVELFNIRRRSNIMSKGLPKTILETAQLNRDIEEVLNGKYGDKKGASIQHAEQLYKDSIAGALYENAVKPSLDWFTKYFPYNSILFNRVFSTINALAGEESVGDDLNTVKITDSTLALSKQLTRNLKAFIYTLPDIIGTMNLNQERLDLITDDTEKITIMTKMPFSTLEVEEEVIGFNSDKISLTTTLKKLSKTSYYKSNAFLKALQVKSEKGHSYVSINNERGDKASDDRFYIDFLKLITDDENISIFVPKIKVKENGEKYIVKTEPTVVNTKDLAVRLIKNALLFNSSNKANSYFSHIPAPLLSAIGIGKGLTQFNWNNIAEYEDKFVTQFVQHNINKLKPISVPTISTNELLIDFMNSQSIIDATYFNLNNSKIFTQFEIPFTDTLPKFKTFKYGKNKTLLYKRGEYNGIYSLINTLGDGVNTEYNVALDRDYIQDSIYSENKTIIPQELYRLDLSINNTSTIDNVDKKVEPISNTTLLKNIHKNASPSNKELIDRMLQISSINSTSVVYEDNPEVNGIKVNGYYNADTSTIVLKNSLNSALMEETIIHESIHSILINAIDDPTESQLPYVNRLKNILKYYLNDIDIKELQKFFPNVNIDLLQKVFIDNMTSNEGIHEFIAQALSSERFRNYLSSKNILEKIYNYIKEILKSTFNVQRDEINLLNSIENNIFAIMDNIIETSKAPSRVDISGVPPTTIGEIVMTNDKITNELELLDEKRDIKMSDEGKIDILASFDYNIELEEFAKWQDENCK